MSAVPYILFWGLLFYVMFTPKKHAMLYFVFGAMPFGSFAVVAPWLTGGITLTAAPLIALIFFWRTFFVKGGLDTFTSLSLTRSKLMYLFIFWVIGIFATLTMPHFFKGSVQIIPVRALDMSYSVPLEFSPGNFTQLMYVSISVLTVYAFTHFLKDRKYRHHAINAICLGSALCVLTGFLDYFNQYISLDFIITPFKNANYALVEQEILGAKRINGFMPEPSAFADLCINMLATLYFFRRTIEVELLREVIAPVLIILLFSMVWLSTSSSGLVGLMLLILLIITEWFWRIKNSGNKSIANRGLKTEFWLFNLILTLTLVVLLFKPSLFNPVIELLDTMVFQKTDSSSFDERSMWTATAWQALIDSYGVGIGFGSTRASNNAVVLMSSVGFIGAFFYYGFILQSYLRKTPQHNKLDAAMLTSFRWSFVPPFIIALLIGSSPDFGLFNSFRYGLVAAIAIYGINESKYELEDEIDAK